MCELFIELSTTPSDEIGRITVRELVIFVVLQ
jgi:hypothetical protein